MSIRLLTLIGSGRSTSVDPGPDPDDFLEIITINSGDGEMYVWYDTNMTISSMEYRIDDGSWELVDDLTGLYAVIEIANSSTNVDVEIKANDVESNSVEGRASQRTNLQVYLALDQNVHSQLSNVTFNYRNFTENKTVWNVAGRESWEGSAFGAYKGSVIVDHEGHLRCYYRMVFTNGNSYAVARSTDNGQTWHKIRNNAHTAIVNNSQSNLIFIPPGSGGSSTGVSTAVIYFDADAPSSERYKCASQGSGWGGAVFVSTSEDGITFTGQTQVISSITGDSQPNGFFYNGSQWELWGRGRGDGTSIPSSGPPKPFADRRWGWRGLSDTFDGTYTVTEYVIKPDEIWGWDNNLDNANQWTQQNDPCSPFGVKWIPNQSRVRMRPDFYSCPVTHYKGLYIGTFATFFRHDNTMSPTRLDRTTGSIYGVLGFSRDGVNWMFPTTGGLSGHGVQSHDLTPFLRTETQSCHPQQGIQTTGQVYTSYNFAVQGDKMFAGIKNRWPTHYAGSFTNFDGQDRSINVQSLTIDRFARIQAGGSEGFFRTERLLIPKGTTNLKLNATINGQLRCEVLNSITGNPLPGFGYSDSVPFIGYSLEDNLTWTNRSISEIAGQNCRLRFYFTNGSLYSFYFS